MAPGAELQPFEAGVRCEVCHGAGGEHVKSAGAVKPFTLRGAPGVAVNDYCGNCHRKPPAAGEETDFANAWNARHQPIYLAQSACFRGGQMTCFTCHDPHSAKTRDTCATCHARPKHRVVTTGQSCASCHMPAVRPQPNLRFANHWIGVYAPGNPLRPRTAASAPPVRK